MFFQGALTAVLAAVADVGRLRQLGADLPLKVQAVFTAQQETTVSALAVLTFLQVAQTSVLTAKTVGTFVEALPISSKWLPLSRTQLTVASTTIPSYWTHGIAKTQ